MTQFIIMTSTAIDQALMNAGFSDSTMLPREVDGLVKVTLGPDVIGYRTKAETAKPYFAMISVECLETLFLHGVKLNDAYRRIARVVSSMQSPPVHLPRQWSEYHFKNLITFFAASRDVASHRWIVEINGDSRVAKFDFLSSDQSEVSLQSFTPLPWPQGYTELIQKLLAYAVDDDVSNDAGLASEVDLSIIGSASVVQGLTYEAWSEQLTKPQKDVVNESLDKSIRIVGPAGSGKTLSLCMRALRVARDERVIAQEKKILVATHSWAMSERIDGVLSDLNGGVFPDRITVYPLLSLLDLHVGSIGQKRIDVIGDDFRMVVAKQSRYCKACWASLIAFKRLAFQIGFPTVSRLNQIAELGSIWSGISMKKYLGSYPPREFLQMTGRVLGHIYMALGKIGCHHSRFSKIEYLFLAFMRAF